MFIRGRERVAEVWHRFRSPREGFVLAERDGLFEVRIVANADWSVELFLILADRLSADVQVTVEDARSGAAWSGGPLPLAAAREAVLRLRPLLLWHGGVELAVFDEDDQVTLSPHLEVFVYGRSDRWYYFLRDLGLRRYRALAPRSWRLGPREFPAAPALQSALRELARDLGLAGGA